MLDVVEPRHIAAFLSPFEFGDDVAARPRFIDVAGQLGSGQPILAPELQPEFELARRRLLAEAV